MLGVSEGTFETQDPGDFSKTKKRPIYLDLFGLRLPATMGAWGRDSYIPRDAFSSIFIILHE